MTNTERGVALSLTTCGQTVLLMRTLFLQRLQVLSLVGFLRYYLTPCPELNRYTFQGSVEETLRLPTCLVHCNTHTYSNTRSFYKFYLPYSRSHCHQPVLSFALSHPSCQRHIQPTARSAHHALQGSQQRERRASEDEDTDTTAWWRCKSTRLSATNRQALTWRRATTAPTPTYCPIKAGGPGSTGALPR